MLIKMGEMKFKDTLIWDLFICIYLFLLIYSPRLVTINTIHLLVVVAFMCGWLNLKNIIEVYNKTMLKSFSIFMFMIGVWMGCVTLFNNADPLRIYDVFVLSVEVPICISFIMACMLKESYSVDKLIKMLIWVSFLQSIIAVLMIVSPSFKEIVNNHYYQFWDVRYVGWSMYRMFGFSDNLLHTTPIVQAISIIFIIYMNMNIKNNKYLYLFIPTIVISIIVNARTPFFILTFCLLLYVILETNIFEKIKWVIGSGILLACMYIFVSSILIEYIPHDKLYFIDGVKQVISFMLMEKTEEGFFYDMSSAFIFPNSIGGFLFGDGIIIMQGHNGTFGVENSDIGYINNIWLAGFFYMIAVCVIYVKMIKSIAKININSQWLMWSILVFFIVGHFKGNLISFNDFTVYMLLLSSAEILNKNRIKKLCERTL